jgi:hypothetical protein
MRAHGLLRAVHYLSVLFCASSVTGAEDIVLRASVTPETVWVGQRATLSIDVLGRDGWAQIKKIGDFEVPGAHVVRTQSQGVRLQETIGGESYTGQRYELSIYPQRSGPIVVLALPVEVTLKAWVFNAQDTVQQGEIPAATFMCKVPPGAEGIRELISTTRLTARQTWQPETDEADVGDAITRTIVLQAVDVSGMAFAPMQHPAIEGLGIYPGEPTVEDASDRGSLTGKRIETVTYIFERPGNIEIPGVTLTWWDVGARELKRIELSGRAVQVLGSAAEESDGGAATGSRRERSPLPWSTMVAAIVAVIVGVWFRGRVPARWAAWRKARRESEAAYFRDVMRSIRSGDPKAVLRATMRWLDRLDPAPGPARLDFFLRQYGDASVQEAAAHLAGSLSSGGEDRNSSTLSRGLADARSHWRRRRGRERKATSVLPELNAPREFTEAM